MKIPMDSVWGFPSSEQAVDIVGQHIAKGVVTSEKITVFSTSCLVFLYMHVLIVLHFFYSFTFVGSSILRSYIVL
jgi:hypothetical protein